MLANKKTKPKAKFAKTARGDAGKFKTAFKPEFVEQARKLCQLGATNDEMAEFFGVRRSTFYNWLNAHPELVGALKIGKGPADEQGVRSLFRRMIGCSIPAVKIFYNQRTGEVKKVKYTQYYPPDTMAGMYWLNNRMSDQWRQRADHTVSPSDAHAIGEQLVTLWLEEMKLAREQLESSLPPPTREDAIRLLSKFRPEVAALANVKPASDKIQ